MARVDQRRRDGPRAPPWLGRPESLPDGQHILFQDAVLGGGARRLDYLTVDADASDLMGPAQGYVTSATGSRPHHERLKGAKQVPVDQNGMDLTDLPQGKFTHIAHWVPDFFFFFSP